VVGVVIDLVLLVLVWWAPAMVFGPRPATGRWRRAHRPGDSERRTDMTVTVTPAATGHRPPAVWTTIGVLALAKFGVPGEVLTEIQAVHRLFHQTAPG
jgi:hypothetical protein